MKVNFEVKGSFNRFEQFLTRHLRVQPMIRVILHKYGRLGVEALRDATPKESGLTAESWGYEIEESESSSRIIWTNSHVNQGQVIAVLLQYGHGTGTGGYVEGRDYINPAIQSIFERMADEAWKEVTS